MDENAFRDTCHALNRHECPFEKAIIICRHGCRNARHIGIGERQVIGCTAPAAWESCQNLLGLLRENAVFALGVTGITVLPHAKELKVQCGGLRGLRVALGLEAVVEIDDISDLVAQAMGRFDGLENLPFSEIVRSVAHFEARKKRQF